MTALITDYLEGRMSLIDRVWFRLHTGRCRHCRAYLRQMKLSLAVLREMQAEPVPDGVMDSLLARFDDWSVVEPVGTHRPALQAKGDAP